jgi:hypothetical protein
MSQDSTTGSIDSLAKLEATPEGQRQRWDAEIRAAEKALAKYHDSARKVVQRYIDERDAINSNQKWFNIFNTNVGILESSLYANIPTVDVSRKFTDMDDDVARVAGTILQRCIQQDMSEPDCDFDQVMRQTVSDRLISGLGTAWLRLETETGPQEGGAVDEEGNPLEQITYQEVCVDYVYWEDFLWSPCRVWAERRWVARRVPMTRDQLVERWGEERGKQIPLDYGIKQIKDKLDTESMILQRACVYEIWDIEKRQVIWFSKGYNSGLIEVQDDPLQLHDRFEPCPKPLFANLTTSRCLPKPDFAMIQDQYNELDEVNNRISLLVIACKCVGVYDRSADGIQRMLTEGYDNTLIPVDNWAMFAEKGGVKGQVDWLPLDVVVQALGQLNAHREAIKGQIYELTGINDIVHGNTKASETLGAQELKSKYASVRIQKLQDEVTRFAEDILQIKAQMLTKHVDANIMLQMANVMFIDPNDQQFIQDSMALLKGDAERMEWRITIQSDAMAQIDYARQKTERSEFMTAVATFLQSASTVGQGQPELVPLMLELLKFGVAGFRISKEIEGTFDRYIKEFNAQIEQQKNAPPQPDPEVEKVKMELDMKQQEMGMKQQEKQSDMIMKQQEQQADLTMQQEEHQMKMQQMQQEFALKMQQLQAEFNLKMSQEQQNLQLSQQKADLDYGIAVRDNEVKQKQMAQKEESDKRKAELDETRHKETVAAITKPKTVKRDGDGKVSGVE